MSGTTNVGPVWSPDDTLTRSECEAVVERACFGHLSFARQGHADVVPIRYAFREGWIYFRADSDLRGVIAAAPWLALSVTESSDVDHLASVIVRGGCYGAQDTGSSVDDATAMKGLIELRDRPVAGVADDASSRRSSVVYRLHADEMRGLTVFVPCPAPDRPYDEQELQYFRDAGREQTLADDERADDDGMAEPLAPAPTRSSRTR